MQLNKNIKIFLNYFFGPLLFLWLSWSIFRQIKNQEELGASWLRIRQSFHSSRIFLLLIALLLVPLNWGLEAIKWQLSLRSMHPIRFIHSFRAVLSGVSFSVTMPNRVGEYLGRMMYLPEGHRLRTISVTLVGSFAQLLVTLVMGLTGLFLLRTRLLEIFPGLVLWSQFILYGLLVLVVVLLFFYFHVSGLESLFRRWTRNQKYSYLVEALAAFGAPLLFRLLLLSMLRYLVFLTQYVLLFYLFDVQVPLMTILLVMSVVFIAMAIIPSIALVEVWLRGEVIILLMGMYSANVLGIGFTSVTVWFINLILPAIAGSLLLLNMRIFKKRNESV